MPTAALGEPEPNATETEFTGVDLNQEGQALQKGDCPVEEFYDLMYDHEVILTSGQSGAGEVRLEWNEEEGSSFPVWFDRSGKVTNEGLPNEVIVDLSGWVKVGTDECPVNYITGTWPFTAQIMGTCKRGIVKLEVVEQIQENKMNGSCEDIPFTGVGPYSAPELELSFDLSDPMTNDGIRSGSKDGPLFLFYWYELRPSETSLKPVPIVP
jgi:hypothetical protein